MKLTVPFITAILSKFQYQPGAAVSAVWAFSCGSEAGCSVASAEFNAGWLEADGVPESAGCAAGTDCSTFVLATDSAPCWIRWGAEMLSSVFWVEVSAWPSEGSPAGWAVWGAGLAAWVSPETFGSASAVCVAGCEDVSGLLASDAAGAVGEVSTFDLSGSSPVGATAAGLDVSATFNGSSAAAGSALSVVWAEAGLNR